MTTSKGVFPPINNAIELPIQYAKLLIQPGTNKLRLSSAVSLTNMRPPLVVEKAGTGQMTVFYDQSQLNFSLNFDDWNVDFDNLFFWTSMAGISNFFGNRFDLKAGTTRRARLINVKSLLKKEIRDALEYIPGMSQDADVQDIDLGMTNSKKEKRSFGGWNVQSKLTWQPVALNPSVNLCQVKSQRKKNMRKRKLKRINTNPLR